MQISGFNMNRFLLFALSFLFVSCASNLPPQMVEPADSAMNALAVTQPETTAVVEPSSESPAGYPQPDSYPEPETAAVAVASDYPEPVPTEPVTAEPEPVPAEPSTQPEIFGVEVIAEYPHSTQVFTQGLIWHQGQFYESGGERGRSALYRVNLADGQPTMQVPLEDQFFGEGIAIVEDRVIMLTWQAETAMVYDLNTFEEIGRFDYEGQGWGLCYDQAEDQLWMSNGSDSIVARDPDSFEIIVELPVRAGEQPVFQLNELECVDDLIYANIWKSDVIIAIDKNSGRVTRQINALNLLTDEERGQLQASRQVLNGIAYDRDTGHFYLTGKEWPKLFEVKLVSLTGN